MFAYSLWTYIEGIVQPKMNTSSSITHVIPDLCEFLSFVEHNFELYFDECVRMENNMEVNGYKQLFGYQHFFKYLYLIHLHHLCSSEEIN